MLWLAHGGHWLVNVAYLLPVLAFLGWLALTTVRERRQQRKALNANTPRRDSERGS